VVQVPVSTGGKSLNRQEEADFILYVLEELFVFAYRRFCLWSMLMPLRSSASGSSMSMDGTTGFQILFLAR